MFNFIKRYIDRQVEKQVSAVLVEVMADLDQKIAEATESCMEEAEENLALNLHNVVEEKMGDLEIDYTLLAEQIDLEDLADEIKGGIEIEVTIS